MIKQFTTSIFIINKSEYNLKIALIYHKKFDKWMVPGGHVEINENQVEAAIREANEETGLNIRLFSFLHKEHCVIDSKWILPSEYFYEQLIPETVKEKSHFHLDFAYLAFSDDTELILNRKETKDIKWVNLQDSLKLNLFDGTKSIINEIINKFKLGDSVVYEQNK
jgi:8-oxo-dGTP pyrophosphatase MutT (NUDIX family)